ncbi:MAG TPA: cytosine permease [Ktedonobacteraceae bacterium]|nr:cytosine permease [Ktedonobacteraceae bacterium]
MASNISTLPERGTETRIPDQTIDLPELEQGIETRGIERVPPTYRADRRILNNFTIWCSANMVISTFAIGTLATSVFELGFWDSVVAIVVFNVLGILPAAFLSTLGPKLGLRQMTISRFSFGWFGAMIMALFNVAACIGWSTVNVIVGGQLVGALSDGAIPPQVGILIIAIFTTIISIYGYKYIHRYARYAWMPMAVIFLILFVVSGPKIAIVPTPALTVIEIASFISFGGAVFGYSTGWCSYVADYNVNQPENTSPNNVFWLTFLGLAIPCIVLEIFGVAMTLAFKNLSGGDLLAASAKPLGGFGTFLLLVLSLSVVANNIPNDYSLGLSMQVLGKPFLRINRAVWALIGAVIYVLIAVAASSNFNTTLSNFLLLIAYWLGPWSIILILEHFVFRHGRYNVEDWDNRRKLPIGWAAIISAIMGFVGVLLGAAQVYYVGPIAKLFNPPYGMDIGFELGLVFAGITYFFLRRIELSGTGR